MIHTNSLTTYAQERPKLQGRAMLILKDIQKKGPGTDRQIAKRMGYGHRSAVQPRISDLKRWGLVQETGQVFCKETGKTVSVFGLAQFKQGEFLL